MRAVSLPSASSNRQTSTFVALAENSAKLTPSPSQCAPRSRGEPSLITIATLRFQTGKLQRHGRDAPLRPLDAMSRWKAADKLEHKFRDRQKFREESKFVLHP